MKKVLMFALLACASFSAMAGQCIYVFERPLSSKLNSFVFVNACDKTVDESHWCSNNPLDEEQRSREPGVIVSTVCEIEARFSLKEKHDPLLSALRPSIDWVIERLEKRPGSEEWTEENKKVWRKYIPVID